MNAAVTGRLAGSTSPRDAASPGTRGSPATGIGSRLAAHVPLVLVVVALTFLALLPFVIQHTISVSLNEVEHVLEPASAAVSDMQVSLALEAAGTRGYLLTGEERYATGHLRARAARAGAYARVSELSPLLKPELRAEVLEIGRSLAPADRLLDELYNGSISRKEYMAVLPAQHRRFEAVTAATARVQQALRLRTAEQGDRIRLAQRASTILSLAGVLLAMGAVVAVARLSAKAERRREQVEHISASREMLIRGFSHDLKNPLGAAEGYLVMLQRGVSDPLTPGQQRGVERSRRSVRAAVQLIEDLLQLARIETGRIELHPVTMDLREVVTHAVDDYRAQADSKALAITTDVPPALPTLSSDPARVGQVLGNLISNAIKYTDTGSVTVRVAERRDDRSRQWAVVEVSDTGVGIPREHRDRIFDEFERLDITTGTGGSGIGLAISQRVATALGGHITVESEPGRGSRFTLWLPVHAAG